jgi:hypothetical protein
MNTKVSGVEQVCFSKQNVVLEMNPKGHCLFFSLFQLASMLLRYYRKLKPGQTSILQG